MRMAKGLLMRCLEGACCIASPRRVCPQCCNVTVPSSMYDVLRRCAVCWCTKCVCRCTVCVARCTRCRCTVCISHVMLPQAVGCAGGSCLTHGAFAGIDPHMSDSLTHAACSASGCPLQGRSYGFHPFFLCSCFLLLLLLSLLVLGLVLLLGLVSVRFLLFCLLLLLRFVSLSCSANCLE